jgi:hypothetical protein
MRPNRDVSEWGGVSRSSEEAPVMGVERRAGIREVTFMTTYKDDYEGKQTN